MACSIALPSSRDSIASSADCPARFHVQRRRLRLGGRRRVGRAVEADGGQLAAAEMIDGDVVGDLEQPAREFELGPVAIDVVQDLDEGVLREVFGGLPIAHHAEDQREDGSLVSPHQLPKGRLAPFFRERGDVGIREVTEIESEGHSSRERDSAHQLARRV